MKSLLIPFLLLLTDCSSVPLAPSGQMFAISAPATHAQCSPFGPAESDIICPQSPILIEQMINYVCFAPLTWERIELYLNKLRRDQCH